MAHRRHHLTLSDLAEREQISEEELRRRLASYGIPILHGRIDRSLYELCRRAEPDASGITV